MLNKEDRDLAWRIRAGHRDGVFEVVRSPQPGFCQYLSARGKASGTPSRYRSREAAERAITKFTESAE